MSERQNVLCCSRDALLLETRRRLLESEGFSTDAALGTVAATRKLAKNAYTLLVLCHTLTDKDCDEIVRLYRKVNPSAPVLLLIKDHQSLFDSEIEICETADGPAAFLASAQKVLQQSA